MCVACAQCREVGVGDPAAAFSWGQRHTKRGTFILFLFLPHCLTKGREETTPSGPKEASQIQAGSEPRQGLRRRGQAASGGPQETSGSQAGSFCAAELSHRERRQHRDLCP